ncbi:MAG: ABC-ATPase domain-containing protein [Clostridia bacterium]|nr:ABC-ATPase domain-containing protein [Clostridia bacterium]
MKRAADLKELLKSINGKSYGAYKSLAGDYVFPAYTLCIDHVQGDPFAAPSKVRVVISAKENGFPAALFDTYEKKTALEDCLLRGFARQVYRYSGKAAGSGGSGRISVSRCGQEVLERSAMQIAPERLEARFEIGFPARGRTVLAFELEKILFDYLPEIVRQSLFYENLDARAVAAAVDLADDQAAIRRELDARGLAAFVADGAILPRESGISDRPMRGGVPFTAPESMAVTLNLPHHGRLRGMGIARGVTLVVGGGYHGKSTLLHALERGVYNHIAGDGREYVVTESSATKIRAEDGRAITDCNISAFISGLPGGRDTTRFRSENASGSTSQAANIAEAIEAGAKLLLIDEDTSATNFMIRDDLMQQLIHRDKEPITPFLELVRPLYEQRGISTILVVGSSGTYFHAADTVVQMDCYELKEITAQAKKVAGEVPPHLQLHREQPLPLDAARRLGRGSLPKSDRGTKIKVAGRDALTINKETIDLRYLEQLADSEQAAAIGYILCWMDEHAAGKPLGEAVDAAMAQLRRGGILSIIPGRYSPQFLAMPRKQEVFGALCRLRRLAVTF